jgi:hypothetical protein
MPSSLKEILISILILTGCLVIFLSDYGKPASQEVKPTDEQIAIEENNDKQKDLNQEEIEIKIFDLFKKETPNEENPNQENSPVNIVEEDKNKEVYEQALPQGIERPLIEMPIQSTSSLSLEEVLAEVDNLSSDLWLEYQVAQQEKSCQGCSQEKSSSTSGTSGICATILAAAGGYPCNCATLGCTPPVGPWCVHPCCCACCQVCCVWGI